MQHFASTLNHCAFTDVIPSHEIPFITSDLNIEGSCEGANRADWKSNGNKRGTLYIVEARYGTTGDFNVIASVPATKYLPKEQTPGVAVYYRISAQRNNFDISALHTCWYLYIK